ncbi:PTS sugar transporter subunit IIA [Pseudoleptotrichia goodfellowii]|uniref:PTS system mannitol/fructose transporter subunit IIA n=1 Tax=Pseudoleptotrichia goodfellowii TaxID=157692 RepID=A0A510JCJ4_9FUSO|nr:PTS sugar transporter subunit IIA [Pseudoleptotrichia goodfellowii]BBM36934.1 PTS system mannitol/fructose transporter subunit IIA [Pseudoleptotrichia goodfellowii]
MKIIDYLTEDRVKINLESRTKDGILSEMAQLFLKGNIVDPENMEQFINDLKDREKLSSTGLQDGIAIPHAKSEAVNKIALAVGTISEGAEFDCMDGEMSKIFFMIAAPESVKNEHLDLLAEISKLSYDEELLEKLENSTTTEELMSLLKSFD